MNGFSGLCVEIRLCGFLCAVARFLDFSGALVRARESRVGCFP